MKIKIFLLSIALTFCAIGKSQITFPSNGAPDNSESIYAFTNAIIIPNSVDTINGTLLIRGKEILGVGTEIIIPNGAIVTDVDGQYIYPSFIDPFTNYGVKAVEIKNAKDKGPQYESSKKGAFAWNESIRPEMRASDLFQRDKKSAEKWVSIGFGTVGTHVEKGLMSGTGIVSSLLDDNENEIVLSLKSSDHLSFDRSKTKQSYPTSLMGRIALLRQTYYDADWYNKKERAEKNLSLQAINENKELTQIFKCQNKFDILRADKIGDEFGVQYVFKGNGDEYQRIDEIKNTNGIIIIPLNFPKAYDVSDYYKSADLDLGDMQHWKMAPFNPAIMEDNNIDFAFTLGDMKESEMFLTNLRKAVKNGLSREKALKALTETPAEILSIQDKVGKLEAGKLASFIICSGDIFEEKTKISENWIQGKSHVLVTKNPNDVSGTYSLNIDKVGYELIVKKTGKGYDAKIYTEQDTISVKLSQIQKRVNLMMTLDDKMYRLSGGINQKNNLWSGTGNLDAKDVSWHAILKDRQDKKESKKESVDVAINIPDSEYPLGGYGWDSIPGTETVLFRRANIWTNEAEGILLDHDLIIHEGKIKALGQNLKVAEILPGVKFRTVIAKDMDLTAGIIDEHSHIAIERGVNEAGQASSAEVRIGDVINPDDVNIYRQLAGGVTSSQLLHGSANPIGGQSAIIKMRWGVGPEQMKFEEADAFIKFALGENVKQSNWGRDFNSRFPQTRMGVEQVYYDYFTRAKAYDDLRKSNIRVASTSKKKKRNSSPTKQKNKVDFRTDLELEALAQILNEKRFITCHSYVQSEINMLMNVADSMGFRVNTFTHILEGYKMADKLKAHGAMASTFSDWWAYKFEVNDAIPYNAALMHDRGITVAINSDDAEMGRRLNQEAAKAVKYGGVSQEEALKMVTLNPAKMLHIDEYVGSIKVGKHADIVLWTGNPLSVYSIVEQTYVDGIMYFNAERDLELREKIKIQRAAIIKEMVASKDKGESTQKVKKKEEKHYHCDDFDIE
ncbi:MAG: imidazolonepropionase-like amidohydrolase [Patiriisocius sp.]|jgi:imidazolonepropionase-like amidohydrolase